ncbi:MAG: accessory gene regulator B family protein [Lachnospiraceae bacterium]|nr:accessory gene regulator B family protein [Lachnospiraceae bacterium]
MDKLYGKIAKWCVTYGNFRDEQFCVIKFGIEVFMDSFLKILGILVLSVLFGQLDKVLIVLLVFCTTKYFAGGAHCESHIGCFLSMAAMCAVSIILSESSAFLPIWIMALMLTIVIINIIKYAPMPSLKNPIHNQSVLARKRLGSIACALIVTVIIVFHKDLAVKWLLVTPLLIEAITISPIFNKIKRRKIYEQQNY